MPLKGKTLPTKNVWHINNFLSNDYLQSYKNIYNKIGIYLTWIIKKSKENNVLMLPTTPLKISRASTPQQKKIDSVLTFQQFLIQVKKPRLLRTLWRDDINSWSVIYVTMCKDLAKLNLDLTIKNRILGFKNYAYY